MTATDTPFRPRPHAGILAVDPYVPGKSKAPGVAGPIYKLSSNETPLGPSPHAKAAFQAAVEAMAAYPDGNVTPLRAAIGACHGLEPDRIVCGAGSDEILFLLAAIYCEPGGEGIYTEHGFLLYRTAILAAEGVPVVVAERDLTVDVDAILAAVTDKTRIVYIANPNNPTGTYVASAEITRLADSLPSRVLLVLDAAYAEYATQADYDAGFALGPRSGERRGDPHVLEDLRPREPEARLVLRAGRDRRRDEPRSAALSTSMIRRCTRGSRLSRTRPISRQPSPTTVTGARF